ncbi:MAG: hypothetical protein V4505_18235 [Pseudomonadota bacterium]
MPGRRRLLADSLASLLDQAVLSALNLVLGLVLIRLTAKESYGIYSQLYVVGIFASSMIDSLVTGPLTTLAPGLDGTARATLVAHLARYQQRLATGLALAFGLLVAGITWWMAPEQQPLALGVAFAVYVYAGSLREFGRSVGFIEARPRTVLRMDALYVLAVAVGIGALVAADGLSLPAVMLVLGLANLVVLGLRELGPAALADASGYAEAVAAAWLRGKWALPGALLAWLTNYSYLSLAALWLGVAATADLNASRLLLMPISLCVLAWSRVARPHVVRLLAERRKDALDRYAWASVAGIEVLTIGYVAVLWLMLPWLQHHVLGAKYTGVEPLVLAWGAYFALNGARWIGSSLLTSGDRYRMLLLSGILCLVVMLAATSYAVPRWGAWGAVFALALVEALDLLLIWVVLLPRVRKEHFA